MQVYPAMPWEGMWQSSANRNSSFSLAQAPAQSSSLTMLISILDLILSLRLCCRSLFLWHPQFSLPSVKAGEIILIWCPLSRPKFKSLGPGPFENMLPQLPSCELSGLPLPDWSSFKLLGLNSWFLYGTSCFPIQLTSCIKESAWSFFLGVSHQPTCLGTVLSSEAHRSLLQAQPWWPHSPSHWPSAQMSF